MPENLLFVPSIKTGNGSGHLKRVIRICQELNEKSDKRSYLFLDTDTKKLTCWIRDFPELNEIHLVSPDILGRVKYDLIILDQRETSLSDFQKWESFGPVMLLDEGGMARYYGSLLIDTLPSIHNHEPNYSGLSLPGFALNQKEINWTNPSVLISFGGEDPEKLTLPILDVLLNQLKLEADKIGVVQGPLMDNLHTPQGVQLYRNLNDLTPLYKTYDILVGAFGMTPLEAASTGCAVILVNPSSYHEKLSEKAGIISAGIRKKGIKKLPLTFQKLIREKCEPDRSKNPVQPPLTYFIDHLRQGAKSSCPLCLNKNNRVIERFQSRSYYHCCSCHNYYMVNWHDKEEDYDREYFFSRYKDQYGKTYLEDFQYIKELGKIRLEEIEKILDFSRRKNDILITDLGCAFGPFLAAAGEKGFLCRGVEINQDGADWIKGNLGFPVIKGSITDQAVKSSLQRETSHIITLWYVIEHLADQYSLLKDLYSYLKPGGLLAFGTPSGKGISARKDRTAFLKASPADHYVIYTPQGVRRILSKAGFTVKKIKSIGHHPERFGKWVGKKGSITYNMVMFISRIFFLGDSLEVYALKADIKEQRK